MTNKQHPIAPPPELVEQWHSNSPLDRGLTLATQAAQWGANQELDACCEWLSWRISRHMSEQLRATRRPKPQSETDQALAALERQETRSIPSLRGREDCKAIRRCLERLKKLEEATND